jgi:hypothetical protein
MRLSIRFARAPGIALAIAALALLPWSPARLRAEIIDRIAVSAGNKVITATDLEREIRVAAFLNRQQPDLSPSVKQAAAERLVDQKLVQRELEASRYPAPPPETVDPVLSGFIKENFQDEAAYRAALAAAGITEAELRDAILWRLTLASFTEERFRPRVQVTEREMREYFEKTLLPALQAANPGKTIDFDDYRTTIEEAIATPRVQKEIENWLREARSRTDILFHYEVLQ